MLLKFCITLITVSCLSAQLNQIPVINPLDIDITDVTADTSQISEIKISVSLPYDLHSFERVESEFICKYEAGLYVENERGEIVFNDILKDKISLLNYESTNSAIKKNTVVFSVRLEAGNYIVNGFIYDQLSRTNFNNSKQYALDAPYSSKRMLSKLRVYNLNNGEREVVRDNRFYDNEGQIEIEFYSYNPQRISDLTAEIEISTLDGDQLYQKKIEQILYDANFRAILFTVLDKDVLKQKRSTIHVSLFRANQLLDETFSPLFFSWKIIPRTTDDMKTALVQMRYILDPDTLDFYLKTEIEESQKFFKRFWFENSKLKTEADAKAMKDEYFERVDYANQHFGKEYRKLKFENSGWATDRGRIYIKFGKPDLMSDINVETLGAFKNYSITWSYKLLQKKFVFFLSRESGEYILDGKSENAEHSM